MRKLYSKDQKRFILLCTYEIECQVALGIVRLSFLKKYYMYSINELIKLTKDHMYCQWVWSYAQEILLPFSKQNDFQTFINVVKTIFALHTSSKELICRLVITRLLQTTSRGIEQVLVTNDLEKSFLSLFCYTLYVYIWTICTRI